MKFNFGVANLRLIVYTVIEGGETMTDVGARIKKRRTQLGISAEELADRIKMNPASVYRYEKGEIKKLPTKTLLAISEALDTSVDWLLGETDNSEAQMYTDLEWNMMRDVDDMVLLEYVLIRWGYGLSQEDQKLQIKKGQLTVILSEEDVLAIARDLKRYLGYILSERQ